MRYDERLENDTTPSQAVAERYRASLPEEDSEASLALVHYRGRREELELGVQYSRSPDPLDRVTGADILAQLGLQDPTFLEESVAALLPLLGDGVDEVVAAAAVALGHRQDPSATPALVGLVDHRNADVRLGVVHGLTGNQRPEAIRALIRLSSDSDRDVRDWATFGLGTQIDADSPEIREALRANLADPDYEIRDEALVGLAKRSDPGIVEMVIREWETTTMVSLLSLEAAELAADPRLLGHLEQFREELLLEDDPSFKSALDDAIRACEEGNRSRTP